MTDIPRDLTDDDRWSFNGGTHTSLYDVLGSHLGPDGTTFRVWAPSAKRVEVVGDFNGWSDGWALNADPSGIWHGHVPGVGQGDVYKYSIVPDHGGLPVEKADPVAFRAEEPPRTGSVVWDLAYEWSDDEWMATRGAANAFDAPISIYEMHLGSWRYEPGGYREIAHQLTDYVKETGFTHVELLPVMEHPFYGSWGYQLTGYYAATSRYGTPQDLMYLVDYLHQNGIGVILDWVPSHFPRDAHGLALFDGSHLYEHQDPKEGYHPDWDSLIFNYDRYEVRSFLLSSAMFWLEKYHADGIRVDAVASMLYRDYSRKEGEWIPNEFGGRENLGAISLLQQINKFAYGRFPDIQMYAEESTAFPAVTRPIEHGGLGFGQKWDMGWMNDTLEYFALDPVHRRFHHHELSFRMVYAFNENFTLPLSHDEVVHGKGSLLAKQPGDRWQKFAGLRLLLAYQYAQPGKKLLFMGSEFGADEEWAHTTELNWGALEFEDHAGVKRWVADLNELLRAQPSLHERDFDERGFRWIIGDDADNSIFAFVRLDHDDNPLLWVGNFTPVVRHDYRIGVPVAGEWVEILNSDDARYGGSGVRNESPLVTTDRENHGFAQSLSITVPPLAGLFLTPG
ncbi:MAG: 1,4-alpha-glucan branching protein GlgB [Acidimicrobiia bacterium]